MAEQRLDVAQIGAAPQQLRRTAVAQRVRREPQAEAIRGQANAKGSKATWWPKASDYGRDAPRQYQSGTEQSNSGFNR